VEVREIVGADYAERMNALLEETMQRTGGDFHPVNWHRIARLCLQNPGLARLSGLFRTDVTGPESLVAFALGLAHGDHVEYSHAASTRDPSLRIPLVYALAWDLICWGKTTGATWFDFGGISPAGHAEGGDATGGISDFKRYFSRDVVQVGEDWSYEPHPMRAALARGASSAVQWLKHAR
jgi:lipid II:glycine glycyltransferase (peptidoglycan interpeptide bridge formation enzyme)